MAAGGGGGGGGGGGAAALVAGTGAGAVVWIVGGDGAAEVSDGDGRGAARVALWAAVDVVRLDGVPFVVLAWAATLISSNKAIPPSAVITLCLRTHNIHGAGPRGA